MDDDVSSTIRQAINAGVLRRTLELLPAAVPLTCLPPAPFGKSVEHDDFPG